MPDVPNAINALLRHVPNPFLLRRKVTTVHICSLFHFHCRKHHSQLDLQVDLEDALLTRRP